MSLLFQVGRQQGADRARSGPPTTPFEDAARARLAERVLVAEADAFGSVRAASQSATVAQDRAQRLERLVAVAGLIGLVGTGLGAIPRLVPYQYAAAFGCVSALLLAMPLGLVLRAAFRDGRRPDVAIAEDAAQARAYALFAGRLGRALAPTASGTGSDPLSVLVDGVEADLARLTRTVSPGGDAGRRHRRIVPRQRKVVVKTKDGRSLTGNIRDVSLSGVALSERLPRVEIGDKVKVGSHLATVARIWEDGMGLRFETLLSALTFNEDLVL